MTIVERLAGVGVAVPEIMVPGPVTAPEKWAVIACDQFSSEPAYWEETRRLAGASPSTLNMIIPECYLEDGNRDVRVRAANSAMADYVQRGVLRTLSPGFVLVNRSTTNTSRRQGLVLALDLEFYDFSEGSRTLIRPTEGTIRDRLPPRMAVRRGALLDLPHILILIDDPSNSVMQAAENAAAGQVVYDFDLMQGGGHVKGRHIPADSLGGVAGALEKLASGSDLLFAVGDGNHSLASAKEIWREKKAAGAPENHPSRYALVEVENIHDRGLHFHPIHRVLFNVDAMELRNYLKDKLKFTDVSGADSGPLIMVIHDGTEITTGVPAAPGRLVVEPLQAALDAYLENHPDAEIDYIHGEEAVKSIVAARENRLGLILPEMDKTAFFRRITGVGPYPRKTFSIGEAFEKRYYLEARKLDY